MSNVSKIVDVPVKMEKFFGKGKMLHPSINDIEELVKTIPKGFVATIDTIGKLLANDFGTDVACPMRTGNGIKKIADRYLNQDVDYNIPFWRVVRSNNLVVKSKNYELSASQIEGEGFSLEYTKSEAIKVIFKEDKLFTF